MSLLVQVRTSQADAAEEELRSFHQWLNGDPDIRRQATISMESAAPAKGEMGASFEVIKLVLESGFQVATFALSYVTWRGTRRNRPAIIIERNGVSVSIDSDDPEVIARAIRELGP